METVLPPQKPQKKPQKSPTKTRPSKWTKDQISSPERNVRKVSNSWEKLSMVSSAASERLPGTRTAGIATGINTGIAAEKPEPPGRRDAGTPGRRIVGSLGRRTAGTKNVTFNRSAASQVSFGIGSAINRSALVSEASSTGQLWYRKRHQRVSRLTGQLWYWKRHQQISFGIGSVINRSALVSEASSTG